MAYRGRIENNDDLRKTYASPERFTAGFAIGIIAVHLIYPKMPGNVANATTYSFPVLYKEVDIEIEKLFEGDPDLKNIIIEAAKELENQGVRAIIGACGYFAHFQKDVANAVNVPVFLSSLCQLPLIKTSLSDYKKIFILAASGDNIDERLLEKVGSDMQRIVVHNIGTLDSFSPIRFGKTKLDNGKLMSDLCEIVLKITSERNDIGAILLECSDLPPYAKAIQDVTNLPVFDFNTMIDLVYHAVVQWSYFGWM